MKILDYLNNQTIDVQIEELGKGGTGHNSPSIVNVNGVKGFRKRTITCPSFDSFEYLISLLGKLLDIKVADTYLFDDRSIFSKSVINDGDEFISDSDMSKFLSITEDEITELENFNKQLDSLDIGHGYIKYIPRSPEEVEYAVNIFIRKLDKLNLHNKAEIVKDYIRMCFLDCLTGNKDRTGDNFGFVKNGNHFHFAPLFDSSTILYPNIDDNFVQLGNYCIDRNTLLDCITSKFSNYIEDILNKNMEEVRLVLSMMSERVLKKPDKERFDSIITNNILADLSKKQMQDQDEIVESYKHI